MAKTSVFEVLLISTKLKFVIKYLRYYACPDWLATVFILEDRDTLSLKVQKYFIKRLLVSFC